MSVPNNASGEQARVMDLPKPAAGGRGWAAKTFRSLRHRDFALFWGGNFLSNIGTWMQNLALGWLILEIGNSKFLLGLNGFLGMVPSLVFSLPGGAIADRLSRRKLMLYSQTAMMLLAFALGVLSSLKAVNVAEILLISFLTGAATALNNPAYQALVPDLVPGDDLINAISLNSAQFNMSRAIGPTLAGIALGGLGVAACFYLNAVSFLALIIALFMIVVPSRNLSRGSTLWEGIIEGVRYLNVNRIILILLTIPAFLSLMGMPVLVLMPAFARADLHLQASGLGYLMAGAGLGAVTGALVLARQSSAKGKVTFAVSSAVLFSLSLIAFSVARTFWSAFGCLVVLGAAMVGALALTNTTLQVSSPPQLRGRVMSFFSLASLGLAPIGSLQAGAVAQAFGTRFALGLGGTTCLIYFSILLAMLPRLRRTTAAQRPAAP